MTVRDNRVVDVPVAVPIALSKPRSNHVQNAPTPRSGATTTAPAVVAPSRVGRRALNAIRESLSQRDRDVIERIAAHRYLTSRQVERFCFADHATPLTGARVCRRVLRRLHREHVLEHIDRRIGGVRAGSASYVWRLGSVADRILRDEAGGPRRRGREPGLLFLGHCLAVADAHLALIEQDRTKALELISVQTEPECWRTYTGIGGARLILQPDLYVVTGAEDFEDHWFVEIDRGTENPARLITKCHRYEAYRHTGTEQADGRSFPVVVWVMRDEPQAERLRVAITADASLDERIYRVTTADDFAALIRDGAL